MTIEIKDGRYVSQIYFLGADHVKFDVMGMLWRDPGEPFHLRFRFRFHDGEQDKGPFGDGDTKRWTEIVFQQPGKEPASEAEAVAECATIFRMLAAKADIHLQIVPVGSDDAMTVADALRSQSWAHTMRAKKPGAEA